MTSRFGILKFLLPILLFLGCTDKPTELVTQIPEGHYSEFTPTELVHKLKINSLTFEQDSVPPGWEIGVFTRMGVLSGAATWTGDSSTVIYAYGADDNVDQFYAGEVFCFKLWDKENSLEYYASPTRTNGYPVWTTNGFSEMKLDGYTSREIAVELTEGWNLISINLTPDDPLLWQRDPGPEIKPMMAQLRGSSRHHLFLMKNERGNFYAPAINDFNNIPYWNLQEGYQVKVDSSMTVRWYGRQIEAQEPIEIAPSWNMIAYYPNYPLDARPRSGFRCVSSIVSKVVIAKDGGGNFMIPHRNFSNMSPWQKGQGYQINVWEYVWLQYSPEDLPWPVDPTDDSLLESLHWTRPRPTGSNMSVLLMSIEGFEIAPQDELAAFDSQNRIVGVGRPTDGMIGLAVWGDDPLTDAVDGMDYGEAFTLRYWSEVQQREIPLAIDVVVGMGLEYRTDDYVVVRGYEAR